MPGSAVKNSNVNNNSVYGMYLLILLYGEQNTYNSLIVYTWPGEFTYHLSMYLLSLVTFLLLLFKNIQDFSITILCLSEVF